MTTKLDKAKTDLTIMTYKLAKAKTELPTKTDKQDKGDLSELTTKLNNAESELTFKTDKLDYCSAVLVRIRSFMSGNYVSGDASTEAPLDMIETDFFVKNVLVKKSTLNTSLIVNYIQVGLIAVLSAVVAYLYKGI